MEVRKAFANTLQSLMEKNPKIVMLDADLAKAGGTFSLRKVFPDRAIDCGIAECNMQGVAAGMASCGLKPCTNTFAMFAAGRSWEQVRNTIAYPGLNVKVIGSHGGLSVGEDGATHQCIEDFATMRSIPGMLVLCPCDGYEMRCATKALLDYEGPAYMRLGRLAVEIVSDKIEGYEFKLGKGCVFREGSDVTMIANGLMVQSALLAADMLAKENISARVVNMHTIKPIDEELVLKCAKETGAILTCEEHSIIGGLGSAVSEYLSGVLPIPVMRVGVNDEYGRSGKADQVMEAYGLSAENIVARAKELIYIKNSLI